MTEVLMGNDDSSIFALHNNSTLLTFNSSAILYVVEEKSGDL